MSKEGNMRCQKVELIVKKWEKDGFIGHAELKILEQHITICHNCQNLSPLLSLLKRDLPPLKKIDRNRAPIDPDLTDSIMDRIEGKKVERKAIWLPRLTAAAALLITLLSLGIYFGSRDTDYLLVRFEIQAPHASSVSLVGDFTDWEEEALILDDRDGDGIWEAKIKLKKGNLYKYNFLVDGEQWITDPSSHLEVDDGFGGKNSLIQI